MINRNIKFIHYIKFFFLSLSDSSRFIQNHSSKVGFVAVIDILFFGVSTIYGIKMGSGQLMVESGLISIFLLLISIFIYSRVSKIFFPSFMLKGLKITAFSDIKVYFSVKGPIFSVLILFNFKFSFSNIFFAANVNESFYFGESLLIQSTSKIMVSISFGFFSKMFFFIFLYSGANFLSVCFISLSFMGLSLS